MPNRNRRLLLIGLLVVAGSSATAWDVRYPAETESAPAERVLAEARRGAVTWDLPVTRNERVDRFIRFLSDANSDHTRTWLERSGRYAPYIREQLRAQGMPEDLVYLAFIESGFSPRAYSRAKAAGIWQFIEETGERYGLTVNSYVDERRDPIEATRAALNYLQDLHDQFDSWYLAAAAYNSGEYRVARVLKQRAGGRTGEEDLFWAIAPYLPRETRDYVPLMLAAGHIGKNPGDFGFDDVAYQSPLAFDTAWVPGQSRLSTVAQAAGVDETVVRDLNPHLVRGITPPNRAWPVRIPPGSMVAFASNFPTLYRNEVRYAQAQISLARASAASQAQIRFHRVNRGENLSGIAERYRLSVKRLQTLNDLGKRTQIRPGQRLRVS
jgi:membrane-bound lytic murein transglycosylase D